jgi:mannose-6-phosphate isomerase-like protein (cupin superfamily)
MAGNAFIGAQGKQEHRHEWLNLKKWRCSMMDQHPSRVISLAEAQKGIPGPAGEHSASVFHRGPLDVALSTPIGPSQQTPHAQDEIYFVVRGRGVLFHNGRRDPFEPGDLMFVAAGIEHQIEEISDDFAMWRVFYGPPGGEVPA